MLVAHCTSMATRYALHNVYGYSLRTARPHLLVSHRLHQRALVRLIQPIQLRHVFPVQLKPIQIRVLLDPRRRVALGQRHKPVLQTPPHQHLRVADVVLLRDALQRRVRGLLVAHKRAVRLDDNVVVLAVLDGVFLLAPGVQLQIVSENRGQCEKRGDVPRSG